MNSFSRADFLKLGGLAFGAGLSELSGLSKLGQKLNLDARAKENDEPVKTIAEFPPMCPDLVTLTKPISLTERLQLVRPENILQSVLAYPTEQYPTETEHSDRQLPRMNHARWQIRTVDNRLSTILNITSARLWEDADGKSWIIQQYTGDDGAALPDFHISEVEVSEDRNPLSSPELPQQVFTLIPEVNTDPTMLALVRRGGERELGEITELFNVSRAVDSLLVNVSSKFSLEKETCMNVPILETQVIDNQCVLVKFKIDGRQGLVALDINTRKPIDIFDLFDSTNSVGLTAPGLGISLYDGDIQYTNSFGKHQGVLLSEPGIDTIIDLNAGIVATQPLYTGNAINGRQRQVFTLAYFGDHTQYFRYGMNKSYVEGPNALPACILLLPWLGMTKEGEDSQTGNQLIADAYDDHYTEKAKILAGQEKYIELEVPTSDHPPRIVYRQPIAVSTKKLSAGEESRERPAHYQLQVSEANPLDPSSFGKKIGTRDVTLPYDARPGDIMSHQKPTTTIEGRVVRTRYPGTVEPIDVTLPYTMQLRLVPEDPAIESDRSLHLLLNTNIQRGALTE